MKNEAPLTSQFRHLLPTLRREQNPTETKISSRQYSNLRSGFFSKGDKILVIFSIFSLSLLSGCTKQSQSETEKPSPTQIQAGSKQEIKAKFLIYTNNLKRDFSAPMYHNLSQDSYIKDSDPETVIVTNPKTTWGDFFSTLPFTVTNDCLTTGLGEIFCTNETSSLKFYLNGDLAPNLLNNIINEGDTALISFGPKTDPNIKSQLKQN